MQFTWPKCLIDCCVQGRHIAIVQVVHSQNTPTLCAQSFLHKERESSLNSPISATSWHITSLCCMRRSKCNVCIRSSRGNALKMRSPSPGVHTIISVSLSSQHQPMHQRHVHPPAIRIHLMFVMMVAIPGWILARSSSRNCSTTHLSVHF
jgi:hypothetical protein